MMAIVSFSREAGDNARTQYAEQAARDCTRRFGSQSLVGEPSQPAAVEITLSLADDSWGFRVTAGWKAVQQFK